jgi:hypothetical protein
LSKSILLLWALLLCKGKFSVKATLLSDLLFDMSTDISHISPQFPALISKLIDLSTKLPNQYEALQTGT